MKKDNIQAPIDLIHLDCIHCALNQVINTTEVAGTPEPKRRELMQQALRLLADNDVNRNNCIQIEEIYRMVCDGIGIADPYRETRLFFDREMYSLLPELRKHVHSSDDPLRAAVRCAIAGNLIDLAALGLDVTLEKAFAKVQDVDREGLYIDHCASLDAALRQAKTLLVLGDNCGEIALDRLLIEVLKELYPQLSVKYGVRGAATVNDVTREDAEAVQMEQVAEVVDNGDSLLTTMLCRCSDSFKQDFYAADVIIAKGMGNYEGLHCCDRGNIWFMLIAKCNVLAGMTNTPKGSILCLEKPM
ncbi:MAG: DUF89 family protein [Clostridia bacterium]|nr:DUF89 family protein [Clostridia bacterium]